MQDENSKIQTTTVFIPEIIKNLIIAGQKDQKYSMYLASLVQRWTKKPIPIDFLKILIDDQKFGMTEVKWISSKDLAPSKLYRYSVETFYNKNLVTRFSPEVNLLGEVIGQLLGQAELHGSYILTEGSHLVSELKDNVSIFLNSTNELLETKRHFFNRHIPALLATGGLRWSVIMITTAISLKLRKPNKLTLPSLGLAVFDP